MSSEQSDPSPDEEHGSPRNLPLLVRFIATGFFSGYSPWASGTVGSLVGALFFLIPGFGNPPLLAIMILVGFVVGVYTANQVAQVEGNRLTKSAQRAKERFQPEGQHEPDPSMVVIDEMVGMWIALFAIPISAAAVVVAFVAFRMFDIVKPFPARQLEKYPNGWGIMMDDVVAGIYANIATRVIVSLVLYLFPHLF